MGSTRLFVRVLGLCAFIVASGWAAPSRAAIIQVQRPEDIAGLGLCLPVTGFNCSLRAAIQDANANAGDDTILLPEDEYVLTLDGEDIGEGDLDIEANGSIEIIGSGLENTIIDGNGIDRIFNLESGAKLFLNDLTLRGGNASLGFGGAIVSIGDETELHTNNVLFFGNHASAAGAAIYFLGSDNKIFLTNTRIEENSTATNGGTLVFGGPGGEVTIESSQIRNNFGAGILSVEKISLKNSWIANNQGSGFEVLAGGLNPTATIESSTISGNLQGGIFNNGSLVVKNSTVSGNRYRFSGAGITASGFATSTELYNVTVFGNVADADNDGDGDGGGLYNFGLPGAFVIRNSVVAGNTDRGGESNDCHGSFTSGDYNFIGDGTGCDFVGDTSHHLAGDPGLETTLRDNGGLTPTHGLLQSSRLIDAANPAGCGDGGGLFPLDQRGAGFPRTVDGNGDSASICDIGAFEFSFACGNGAIEVIEECDDGNLANDDGCSAACRFEKCGDGAVQSLFNEECDDGNAQSNDGCSNLCKAELCGDGIVQASREACDDGNSIVGDGCDPQCRSEFCGDGVVQANGVFREICDDGNRDDGDGCSSLCRPESSATVDSDGDGLSDPLEELLGTDPHNSDTDGDGVGDLEETQGGHPIDSNNDGFIDAVVPNGEGSGSSGGCRLGRGSPANGIPWAALALAGFAWIEGLRKRRLS